MPPAAIRPSAHGQAAKPRSSRRVFYKSPAMASLVFRRVKPETADIHDHEHPKTLKRRTPSPTTKAKTPKLKFVKSQ